MLEILNQYQKAYDTSKAPIGTLSLYAFAERADAVSAQELTDFLHDQTTLEEKIGSSAFTLLEKGLAILPKAEGKKNTLIIVTDGRISKQDISSSGKVRHKYVYDYLGKLRKELKATSNKNYSSIYGLLLSPTKGIIQRSSHLERYVGKRMDNLFYLCASPSDSSETLKSTVSKAIRDLHDFEYSQKGILSNITRWKMLQAYQPTYFVGQFPLKVKGTPSDDHGHIRFNLSYKFALFERGLNFIGRRAIKSYLLSDIVKTYVTYTGTYDFYVKDKDFSAPVISRRQNPGFLVNLSHPIFKKNDNVTFNGLDVFLQHESNGQTEEEPSPSVADSLAYLSRGWDFYGVETGIQFHRVHNRNAYDTLSFKLSGHHYSSKGIFDDGGIEDNTEWDLDNPSAEIMKYQGVRMMARYNFSSPDKWFSKFKAALIYQTGYREAFENSTFIVELTGTQRVFDIPIFIRYFNGYGDNICSYHQKKRSISVGFEFR